MLARRPLAEESPFELQEMFFSRTDAKGVIQGGNAVFTRVSGYAREDLVGKPHNVIRHPDMPRAVFELFWQTIQANRPIAAYVKNMDRIGRFYWVIACVYPVADGYVSIRIKPTSPLISSTIPALYERLCAAERKSGVSAARAELSASLASLGFKTYEEFSINALAKEMSLRDQAVRQHVHSSTTSHGNLADLSKLSAASGSLKVTMGTLETLSEQGHILNQQAEAIVLACSELRRCMLNVAVAAARTNNEVFNEIALAFEAFAQDVRTAAKSFQDAASAMRTAILGAQERLLGARMQVDMIDFFEREAISASADEQSQKDSERLSLLALARSYLDAVTNAIQSLRAGGNSLAGMAEKLEQAIIALEIIRLSGTMESARCDASSDIFATQVTRLTQPMFTIKAGVTAVRSVAETIAVASAQTAEQISTATVCLDRLKAKAKPV